MISNAMFSPRGTMNLQAVASPGNEVRGHNMNISSRNLPRIFSSSETVLICLRKF